MIICEFPRNKKEGLRQSQAAPVKRFDLQMQYTTQQHRTAGLEVYVRKKGSTENMEPDIPSVIEQLDLRVFVSFDEEYGAYVARCLDTGAVATGATIEEAESLIAAVLQNDFRIAIERGSLKSLLHAPAPFDVTVSWYEMKAADPNSVRRVTVPVELAPGPAKRSVQSELRIIGKSRTA